LLNELKPESVYFTANEFGELAETRRKTSEDDGIPLGECNWLDAA
jgi:hypothetical protein